MSSRPFDPVNLLRAAREQMDKRREKRQRVVQEDTESSKEKSESESDEEEESEEEVEQQPPMTVAQLDEWETKKRAFLAKTTTYVHNNNYYKSKSSMTTNDKWADDQLSPLSIISLPRLQTHVLLDIGAKTFRSISSKITYQTVASLFVLTFNCRDGDGSDIYEDVPTSMIKSEKNYDELGGTIEKIIEGAERIKIRKAMVSKNELVRDAYCFIAGTYMRLFTKSPENYVRVAKRVSNRFEHFYMANFPFEQFHPNLDSARAVKSILELSTIMRNTFYVLLYAGQSTKVGKGIKSFMYVTHISFTGHHPIVLFIKCMQAFGVSSDKLASALDTKAHEGELTKICEFMRDFVDSEEPQHQKGMFQFGRIFDDTFYATLQTKNCKRITLALSYLLQLISPNDNRSVLEIAQISEASDKERKLASTFAEKAYQMLVKEKYTGNYAGLEEVLS